MKDLEKFVRESNAIEGITREPTVDEIESHEAFLDLWEVTLADMEDFVKDIAGAEIRSRRGMNVRVGDHTPPPGHPSIALTLEYLLKRCAPDRLTPWAAHMEYETLHPFMDGNGRSGRALWLWMMYQTWDEIPPLGFLHTFYYQTLSESRR